MHKGINKHFLYSLKEIDLQFHLLSDTSQQYPASLSVAEARIMLFLRNVLLIY